MSLFALLNKVAGAYGMLAVVLSGGAALSQPLGQITMYIYSIVSLVGFIWGLQKISEVGSGRFGFFLCFLPPHHLGRLCYTGERRQDPPLCPPLCDRPPRRNRLHHLFRRRLVHLRSARRQADCQLGGAKGHDGRVADGHHHGRRGEDGSGHGGLAEREGL